MVNSIFPCVLCIIIIIPSTYASQNNDKPLFLVLDHPTFESETPIKLFLESIHIRVCPMRNWGLTKKDFVFAIKESNAGHCDILFVGAGLWVVEHAVELSNRPVKSIVFLQNPILRTLFQLEMYRRLLPEENQNMSITKFATNLTSQQEEEVHVFRVFRNFQTTFLSCQNGSFINTKEEEEEEEDISKRGLEMDKNFFLFSPFSPSCVPNIKEAYSFLETVHFIGFVDDISQCVCKMLPKILEEGHMNRPSIRKLCNNGDVNLKRAAPSSSSSGFKKELDTRAYSPLEISYLSNVNKLDSRLYWKVVQLKGGQGPTC